MFEDEMSHGAWAGVRPFRRIEIETPIVPVAIARAVLEEASVYLEEELPQAWVAQLAERANTVFNHNKRFREQISRKGASGRDYLWSFTRHWLVGLLWKHRRDLHARLPERHGVGHPLPLPAKAAA